jgi:predicted SprT family Zn-dependent metalloprotease
MTSRITLSAPLTKSNSELHVRNNILHEIAHALAGPGHHHDQAWKTIAKSTACNGERGYGHDVKTPLGRYTIFCPACGYRSTANQWGLNACSACWAKHARGQYRENHRSHCRRSGNDGTHTTTEAMQYTWLREADLLPLLRRLRARKAQKVPGSEQKRTIRCQG